jgi:nucleoside 2-deoxyribosyltransferase
MITEVYLAGGMNNSDWQSRVINEVKSKEILYYNPREHKLDNSREYTVWDLYYVKKCDILFAYMQKDNPSGIGLTLEVGYARALDKTIILIDEKSPSDPSFANRFQIVRESASIVFDNLEAGIDFLSKFKNGLFYK